jgi:hypothetical protein
MNVVNRDGLHGVIVPILTPLNGLKEKQRAEGRAKGRAEGLAEGLEKGREAERTRRWTPARCGGSSTT